jgi:hypothetical protein
MERISSKKITIMRTCLTILFALTLASCGNRGSRQTDQAAAEADGGYLHVVEMNSAKAEAGIALDTIRMGRIRKDETVEYRLGVRNTGKEPMVILDVDRSCGCTDVDYPKEPILPGQTVAMTVRYDASGQQGSQFKLLRMRTSLASEPYPLLLLGQVVVGQ